MWRYKGFRRVTIHKELLHIFLIALAVVGIFVWAYYEDKEFETKCITSCSPHTYLLKKKYKAADDCFCKNDRDEWVLKF